MAKKPTTIREVVSCWTRKSGDNLDLHGKLDLLALLNDELYSQYQPFAVKPDYMDRLFAWIDGVSSLRDKKLLFELASWLLFVGEEEMKSLYQSSFAGIITRWVVDEAGINITSNNLGAKIGEAMKKTFFGSMAGMDIGTFCRINGIEGQSLRPSFREQAKIGDIAALRKFLSDNGYVRIVAVEDYVGSGSQMEEACECLNQLAGCKCEILLCPMIVAPAGVETGNRIAGNHISFSPLFPIPNDITITRDPPLVTSEPRFLASVRKSIVKLWMQVHGSHTTQTLFGPFGFRDTGSLLLTYLNCPDNVPPIIHHKSDTWEPLFRRASREG